MFKKKQRNTFKSILYLNKIMSITLKLTIVTTLVCLTQTEPCKPSNVQCLNEYEYKICITINGQASLQGTAKPCPNHQFCDDSKPFPCIDSPTTIKDVAPPNCTAPGNFTATLCNAYYACAPVWRHWEPRLLVCPEGEAYDRVKKACGPAEALKCAVPHVGQPECKEGDVHPANQCNQYYVCARKWLFWEPSLKTCPSGYAFNAALKHCTLSKPLNCFIGNAEATGTLESEIVPDCTGKGRLPSVLCNQYYECVSNGWFSSSYTAQVVVCPEEEAFDQKSGTCEPAKRLGCWIGVATTLAPTTLPPVLPPKCTKNTRYPAQQCNQYYQCIPNWFSWKTVLQTCKEGDAFDPIALECSDALSLNCKIGVPTTTPLPTTPIPTTPMPILPPVCKSTGNHPATLCNEYYKCIRNWFSWKVELQTCKAGDAFDPFKMDCGPADLLNCKRGIQTTVSEQVMLSSRTTPSLLAFIKNIDPVETPKCEKNTKLSASQCNQYYQCVSYWFSWKAVLQTCAPGEAFDATKVACGPAGPLNCSLGVVETTVVSTTNQPSTKMQYTTISPEIITTLLPDLPPTCTTTSNHTAPLCNQYYECIREWFSWTYILLNCPEGLAFDSITLKCVQTTLLKCKIAFNSTLVSTIEISTIAEPSNMVESTTTSISTAETSTIVEKTTNFISTAKNLTLSVPITTSIPTEEILTTVKSIITSIPTSKSSTLGGSTISSIPTSETSTIVKSTITSIPMAESSTLSKSTTVSIPTAETSTMVESITTSIPTEESSTLTETSTLGGSTITSIPTEEISTTFKSTITSIPTLETLTIVKSTITSIPTAKSSTLSKSTTISIPTAETSTLGRSTITSISTKETSTTENSTLSEPITTSIPTEEISTTVKSIITSIPTSETSTIAETLTLGGSTTNSIPTAKSSTLGESTITFIPTEETSTIVESFTTSILTTESSPLNKSTTTFIPTAVTSTIGKTTITSIPTAESSTLIEPTTTSISTLETSTMVESTTTSILTAEPSIMAESTTTSIPTAETLSIVEKITTFIPTAETSTTSESSTSFASTENNSSTIESTVLTTTSLESTVNTLPTTLNTEVSSTTSTFLSMTSTPIMFTTTKAPSTTTMSTTITLKPVLPPKCTSSRNYPATYCNQYYQCYISWFSWKSRLETCKPGLAFNTVTSACESAEVLKCDYDTTTSTTTTTTKKPTTKSTTTTTTSRPISPPECTGPDTFPTSYCNEYYKCVYVMSFWDYNIQTCPSGQFYNPETKQCSSVKINHYCT